MVTVANRPFDNLHIILRCPKDWRCADPVRVTQAAPQPVMQPYEIEPHAYLKRAKYQIECGKIENLFYAAFELRCFVEQRQAQYAEAQQDYLKTIPKSWKLTESFKRLQSTYNKDQIQSLTWEIEGHSSLQMYYVPVTKKLLDAAVRIDHLRHAQKHYRAPDDKWWIDKKENLINLYKLCWVCSQGNMLAPALVDKNRFIGEIAVRVALKDSDAQGHLLSDGTKGLLKVNYLDEHPSSWVCNLDI